MIRGIREIRGYDQPVSSSPSSRTSSSAGSTAARPAAGAPSRLRGGLPEGDRPSRTSGLGGLHKQWCNTGRSGHGSLPVRPVQRARLSAATVQHGQVELNRAASCRMFARYAIATAGCVFPRPGCPLGIRQCSIGHSFSASANRGERRKPAARDGRAVAVADAGARGGLDPASARRRRGLCRRRVAWHLLVARNRPAMMCPRSGDRSTGQPVLSPSIRCRLPHGSTRTGRAESYRVSLRAIRVSQASAAWSCRPPTPEVREGRSPSDSPPGSRVCAAAAGIAAAAPALEKRSG